MKTIQRFVLLLAIFVLPISVSAQEDGFNPLFNGKDLSGWYAIPTYSPRAFAAKSEEDREAAKAAARKKTSEHWRVEAGEIVNDGEGPFLTTENEYRDYELVLEYKTVAKADSGIYLKATPQVQIWDFTEEGGKWKIGADKGSGGLYNNKGEGKHPLVHADKPFGEWNHFRIIMIGERVTVYLNDKLIMHWLQVHK